jgi:hypothetical protein
VSDFFSSTLQVLGLGGGIPEGGLWKNLPPRLAQLQDPAIQSLTFELCGNKARAKLKIYNNKLNYKEIG